MKTEVKKIIKIFLSFVLAAVFVYFAFRGIDWGQFCTDIQQTRWAWVLVFMIVSIAALVFRMFRWRALLAPLGSPAGLLRVWDANNIGNIVNIVVPGSGEFVRCTYVTGPAASYDKVLGTIVSERICDILAIVILMALALLCGGVEVNEFFRVQVLSSLSSRPALLWGVLSAFLLIALLIYLIWRMRSTNSFCAKVASKFKGFADGLTTFIRMPRKWLFMLYTLGIWSMYILMSYSIIKSMPELSHLGISDALFLCAIGNFASVIPVPGGMGAYHYLIALALSGIYGLSWETGLLNATLNHELHAVLILILGIISYISVSISRRKHLNT